MLMRTSSQRQTKQCELINNRIFIKFGRFDHYPISNPHHFFLKNTTCIFNHKNTFQTIERKRNFREFGTIFVKIFVKRMSIYNCDLHPVTQGSSPKHLKKNLNRAERST